MLTADARRTLSQLSAQALKVDQALGLLVGAALPLLTALLYHPYELSMASRAIEVTRQLGLPYVAGELAVILIARRRGLDLAGIVSGLAPWMRFMLFLFLSTFWVSSVAVSAHAAFSTALCLVMIIHLYTGAAAFHLARHKLLAGEQIVLGLTTGLAVLGPIAIHHLAFPPVGSGPETWRFGAPIPGFISSRLFGAWVGVVGIVLLGSAWRAEERRDGELWRYVAIAFAAGLVTWTGTRAALGAICVALAVAVVTQRRFGPRRFWYGSAAAVAIGVVAAELFLPPIPGGVWVRPGQFDSAQGFTSGRLALWANTLTVAVNRPLFGHGMASNWWLVEVNGFFQVQPHNALVEFFMNWGLVPAIPAVLLLATATWRAHLDLRRLPALLPLVMGIDYLLAASMVDGMLHFSEFLMLIMALFGICLGTVASADPAGRRAS